MKNLIIPLFISLFIVPLWSQDSLSFSGKVIDKNTNIGIDFALVSIKNTGQFTYTDDKGLFKINILPGAYHFDVKIANYEPYAGSIKLTEASSRTIYLSPLIDDHTEKLDAVTINAKRDDNFKSSKIGKIELEVKDIKTLPSFMGEVDIIKIAQLLPGVSSVSEGSQGFYVRGGGPDQNLVLLDGAQIYNVSHLFGFFSVFNVDAITSMELMKGGMTADYGGRISSLMLINMKEGDKQKYHINGGIGLISSRIEADGPIQKGKSSFMIAARRTYIDVLMKPFLRKTDFAGLGYYFYDLNLKLNFRLSSKDRLFISAYMGDDKFSFSDKEEGTKMRMPWGNKMASIRWNHLFNEKHFVDVTAYYSQYDTKFSSMVDNFSLTMGTGILDLGGKINFTYLPNIRHRIRYGIDYTAHRFIPASINAYQDDVTFDTGDQQKLYTQEVAAYIADDWDITEKLRLNVGLRYSSYFFIGPFKRFTKNDIGQDSIISYPNNHLISHSGGLEPRISARYILDKQSSIKAGFSINKQYLHLVSISAVSFPTDMWMPSTEKLKPQSGWQATIGYFRNFLDGMLETSVELYYKGMDNLAEFKNGSTPMDNVTDNVDNQLVNGRGWSYGAELFIKKTKGKFTGWIGYTWSKSERLFPEIQKDPFPAKYDRRHDLDLVLSYKLSDKWTFSTSFVFASGNTLTMPSSWYLYDQNVVMEYGSRNSTRMPNYHRLDLSATWYDSPYKKKKTKIVDGKEQPILKRFRNSINFSIYNVYNRANPYFLYLSVHGNMSSENFKMDVKQVSLFPILPSITWNFEF